MVLLFCIRGSRTVGPISMFTLTQSLESAFCCCWRVFLRRRPCSRRRRPPDFRYCKLLPDGKNHSRQSATHRKLCAIDRRPQTIVSGVPVTVPLGFTVLSLPSGVSNAAALSFISASAQQLTFTTANETQNITITVSVPRGNLLPATTMAHQAGRMAGEPQRRDRLGATVNATVLPEILNGIQVPAVS